MTVEVSPIGVTCNLSCPYCYEHPMREAGNFGEKEYDMDAMLRALKSEGASFTLFGGEPLLTDIKDLETFFKFGFDTYGRSSVQTNGSLITDAHIELFKKYKVYVGISMDGPEEMNDTRWAGSLKKTRLMTECSSEAIRKLCAAEIPPGLIVTVHRRNGLSKYRQRMKDWFRELEKLGVHSIRIHALEVETKEIGDTLALTPEESVDFHLDMWEFAESELEHIRFDIFADLLKAQNNNDSNTTCTFMSCDPYTTHAVQGIDGLGHQNNCGRTNKEGIDWLKADQDGYERQVALYHTPQEFGGCQGCRFWTLCKGYCPGTGIDADWRNRTLECESLKLMFGIVEKLMVECGQVPHSLREDLPKVEATMLESFMKGAPLTAQNADWINSGKDLDEYVREYKQKRTANAQ